jgi:hypothetical protein
MNENETINVRFHHGAKETNGLVDGAAYHSTVDQSRQYSLSEVAAAGGKITHVRLLTEVWPGRGRIADVSYIYATLPDGKTVPVQIGVDNLTPLREMKGALIAWATREHVSAKKLGLLDEGNWSILY